MGARTQKLLPWIPHMHEDINFRGRTTKIQKAKIACPDA